MCACVRNVLNLRPSPPSQRTGHIISQSPKAMGRETPPMFSTDKLRRTCKQGKGRHAGQCFKRPATYACCVSATQSHPHIVCHFAQAARGWPAACMGTCGANVPSSTPTTIDVMIHTGSRRSSQDRPDSTTPLAVAARSASSSQPSLVSACHTWPVKGRVKGWRAQHACRE